MHVDIFVRLYEAFIMKTIDSRITSALYQELLAAHTLLSIQDFREGQLLVVDFNWGAI